MNMSVMLLVMLILGVTASDRDTSPDKKQTDPVYNDTCAYSNWNVRCGDKCISGIADCHCGSDIFRPWDTKEHCCITSDETCTKEPGRRGAGVCSQGRKLSKSSHCNNIDRSLQCYNSYQDSRYLGLKSHYTCPNTCVPWQDICQGVSWCEGDHEVCGPDLRCPPYYGYSHDVTKYKLGSSLVPNH